MHLSLHVHSSTNYFQSYSPKDATPFAVPTDLGLTDIDKVIIQFTPDDDTKDMTLDGFVAKFCYEPSKYSFSVHHKKCKSHVDTLVIDSANSFLYV